jgi:hypothetical protein
MRGSAYAEILARVLGPDVLGRHSLALLRGQAPAERDALLDSHSRSLKRHLDNIGAALSALPEPAALALSEAQAAETDSEAGEATDVAARWLIRVLDPWKDQARELAVATVRLIEDSGVLHPAARHQRPLGRGFEALLEERLRRRFLLLPERAGELAVLRKHVQALMEEPARGLELIERDLGSPLDAEQLAWLEAERLCALLRFVRHKKTENGHIRWYLRRNEQRQVVLDRFGVRGHWIVTGEGSADGPARLETTADALVAPGWLMMSAEGPVSIAGDAGVFGVPARSEAPVVPEVELLASDDGLALWDVSEGRLLADVAHDAETDALLDFLDTLDCVADLSRPRERVEPRFADSAAVQWARALLERRNSPSGAGGLAELNVRLVYVPSAIPHQLGGVPLVGMDFLRDRLERAGARVNVLLIAPADFERRIAELLGADVIGIGVYIHNGREVAELVRLLRARDYQGKIILGGPQLRDIDGVQASVSGWDALIRGEAEDALPAVLSVFSALDAGRFADGLRLARSLSGVAIRYGQALLLCDTAERLKASAIACPLPFDWMRGKSERKLQMNFTRGCPYKCVFCPNHQGQLYRAGPADELWRFTALAVADDLDLPPEVERATALLLQDNLGVRAAPRLRVALHVLLRARCDAAKLREMLALIGSSAPVPESGGLLSAWQIKEAWLNAKLSLRPPPRKSRFVLITSEDNTLVNGAVIRDYLRRRIESGLDEYMVFDPGQNTVWDLTDPHGNADEEYIAELVRRNPFAVALGVDGTSNPVIRQNNKPRYTIGTTLAVNRALARHGVVVTNNYILLTPETDLLEAVEAFALFVLLPLPWRDYGQSVNLRVIKEEGTLAHDEGLIFAPDDAGWDEPLRFSEVAELLDRWSLTSRVDSSELATLLWKILAEDTAANALLPLVVERWERNYDSDPELKAISRMIADAARPEVPLVETLRAVGQMLTAGSTV